MDLPLICIAKPTDVERWVSAVTNTCCIGPIYNELVFAIGEDEHGYILEGYGPEGFNKEYFRPLLGDTIEMEMENGSLIPISIDLLITQP